MRILFLAPQPFYQERGTPIAVRLAIEVLAKRLEAQGSRQLAEHKIDLLTYHEGSKVEVPGVTLHRIKAPSFINGVGPGISFKKILCDIIFLFTALRMVIKNRKEKYSLVHAVEESVFIALLIKFIFGIPYIYDMDSSLALQVTEKWKLLRPLFPVLEFFEKFAVRQSMAVVPVCDALAAIADRHGSLDTHILHDVSLIKEPANKCQLNQLKQEISIPESAKVVLYIGNLERYQGIDLLIESFARTAGMKLDTHLVIIGGRKNHIEQYQTKALKLSLADRIHLIGPRELSKIGDYLLDADILASPRTMGNNTPMKIYSYLHSGKPIIATDLPTHTQVLNSSVAVLCKPDIDHFSHGLLKLFDDQEYRTRLGDAARKLAEEKYTFEVFSRSLNKLYDRVDHRIMPPRAVNA